MRVHSPSDLAEQALEQVDALYNLARWLTGNSGDADDLVQETYARALGADARFERGTNLKAWLFRILRNAFLDEARRKVRVPIADPVLAERQEAPGDALQNVAVAEVELAMRELGEDARTIILLDLEGFSQAEIAAILDCAEGTVKSRLSRAKASLRELVSKERRPR